MNWVFLTEKDLLKKNFQNWRKCYEIDDNQLFLEIWNSAHKYSEIILKYEIN